MSHPGSRRPELPDPQHDRHVAFPDDAGLGAGLGGGAGMGARASLPPEAWAPRPPETPPADTWGTGWQPDRSAGSVGAKPPDRPYPPGRRSGNGSLGAKVLAGLVLVPLLLGFFSTGSNDHRRHHMGMGPGVGRHLDDDRADAARKVQVERLQDTTSVAAVLPGTPKVVPVPADAQAVRVEVVGQPGVTVYVEAFASGVPLGRESGEMPYAADVRMAERPMTLRLTATDRSEPGELQCRVYAGDQLVAVSTATSTVTCSPEL